jgi:hypothetical protein
METDMLNRKIVATLLAGTALAAQAGFAAADETDIDFWSKNPRNVQAEQLIKSPDTTKAEQTPPYVAPRRNASRGPVTNPVDQFYFRQSGGTPAA